MAGRDDERDDDAEQRERGRRRSRRDVIDLQDTGRSDRRPRYLGDGEDEPRLGRAGAGGRSWRDDDAPRSRRVFREADDDDRDRRFADERSLRDDRNRRRDQDRHRDDDGRDRHRDDEDDDDDARRTDKRNGGGKDSREDQKGRGDDKSKSDEDKNQDKDQDKDKDDKAAQEQRRKRRPLVIAIGALVLLLLIAGGLYYYLTTRDIESTDDAFTDGRVVNIAPQVSGQVLSLDVTDNQFVHKGDPLVHIDPRNFMFDRDQAQGNLDSLNAQIDSQKLGVEIAKKNYPANLNIAKATLESSKANLVLQMANLSRQKGLPRQATTQQDVDQAQSSYDQAKAQVGQDEAKVTQAEPVQENIGQSQQQVSQIGGQAEQAKGKLDQSNLNVEWAVVRAPQDGWVTQRNVEMGNYIQAGQQIMAIVSPDIWVTANFKETQLDRMRPGQHVDIKVDAYSNLKLTGHVDSIQRGSGSRFSAFPAQNATGNYVKIVQRVPVKILIDSGLDPKEAMPVGLSVVPAVTER